jgi:tetratricopeptide (TPR) repeat protein
MNEELRRRYVRDLVADLQQVGGSRFEQWIRALWDHLAGEMVSARGLNLEGAPVSGHLDAIWPDGSVSEASSEAGYFEKPFTKIRGDFRHARGAAAGVRVIRLFSSRPAGPAVMTRIERLKRGAARRGTSLDVWDARRIAEYIVDQLLLDDRFVTRVGDALPNLRRISEQSAANARLPTLSRTYVTRPEEDRLAEHLRVRRTLLLCGLGGIGKTELACALAHRLKDGFELVIWADAERLSRVEDLSAYDVRLNGYKLNILGLLATHKTLLVLDNVKVDLDMVRLEESFGPNSRAIVTSQVAFGEGPEAIGFLDRDTARQVLSANVDAQLPDAVLDEVLRAVDGHPLVLRLLNRFAQQGHTWEAVARECAQAGALADERRQTVAARILQQHLEVLGPELGFFVWCGSPVVDREFFREVFGMTGLEKLERWSLTARGQSDAVRLHDVVYSSLERLRHRLPTNASEWEATLDAFLAANLAPKGLPFFRVVNRHRELIRSVIAARPRPGALRYAYLHSRVPEELEPRLIGDPVADASAPPSGDRKAWLLSIVEAIEADYRRARNRGDREAAKRALQDRLPVFDRLVDVAGSPENVAAVRHHRAKSLLKLGRVPDAQRAFEEILQDGGAHYSTRLQLARLLDREPVRAKELVFQIIQAAFDSAGVVATSVLIETLATLRRRHLLKAVPEMTERFGDFMGQQIKAAACSGETQPIHAFAAVGPDWAYTREALFLDVLEEIDLGSPLSAEDDDERIAVGRLLTAAGKQLQRGSKTQEARQRFEEAVAFFTALRRRTSFAATHFADALLRLGRAEEAAAVLDTVNEEEREAYWLLRRSECALALGQFERALQWIEKALRDNLGERRPTFLAQRAEVLFASGNPEHEAQLQAAVEACEPGRYRDELEARLQARRAATKLV